MTIRKNEIIIGIITADVEEGEGNIYWKNWITRGQNEEHAMLVKDVLQDVVGLAEREYDAVNIFPEKKTK